MSIILLVFKPVMLYLTIKMARERELDRGAVQGTSMVDSFPSFGNWKPSSGITPTATFQNYQATDNSV
jgi:hypothetical protein